MNTSIPLAVIATALLLTSAVSGQACTTDDFEIAGGIPIIVTIGATTIDENTVVPGYGSGHVNDGCTYYTDGSDLFWWDYPAGLNSMCISSAWSPNPNGKMIGMEYDNDVTTVDVDLHGFFNDVIDAMAFDVNGVLLQQHLGILVQPLSTTPVSFSAQGIRRVEFYSSLTGGDSAFIGEHTYCGNSGPSLVQSGASGGVMTFDFAGFGPGETIAVLYGPGVPWATVAPCGPVALDLTPLNFPPPSSLIIIPADGAGAAQLVRNVPAGGAGLLVQGVGVGTCGVSNSVTIP